MKQCPACATENLDEAVNCAQCNYALPANQPVRQKSPAARAMPLAITLVVVGFAMKTIGRYCQVSEKVYEGGPSDGTSAMVALGYAVLVVGLIVSTGIFHPRGE